MSNLKDFLKNFPEKANWLPIEFDNRLYRIGIYARFWKHQKGISSQCYWQYLSLIWWDKNFKGFSDCFWKWVILEIDKLLHDIDLRQGKFNYLGWAFMLKCSPNSSYGLISPACIQFDQFMNWLDSFQCCNFFTWNKKTQKVV